MRYVELRRHTDNEGDRLTPPGAADAEMIGQEGLPEGGRALAAGHSPATEAAVPGLAGLAVPPLGKGKGVLLAGDGEDYRVEPLD